jgi:predicted TIM-barrel fold metal-dependent hydrolase
MWKATAMEWIDTHVHISGVSPDGSIRESLAQDVGVVLDGAGAELRFVVNCCEAANAAEFRRMMEQPEGVLEASRHVRDLTELLPGRVYGSCMVNPRFPDASLETMDTAFGQWGFVMLGEMVQYMMDYRMDSDPVERLVRKAVEFDVPIQVHISTSNSAQGSFTSGTEELLDFLGLVQRVPEAKYLLAHFVGSPSANPTVVEGYLDIIDRELGGWPQSFWAEIIHFHSPGVPVALARIPHDRLMAGTDWVGRPGPPFLPYGIVYGVQSPERNPYPPRVAGLVDLLVAGGASQETVRAIASENAARLLKLGLGS